MRRPFTAPKVRLRKIPAKFDRAENTTFILNAWRHLSSDRLREQLAKNDVNSAAIRMVLQLREERDRKRALEQGDFI